MSSNHEVIGGFELRREWAPMRTLLAGVWRSWPLVVTLARQNFYVRYRRASLGLLWAVGIPFVQAMVLAFVFSRVLRVGTVDHFAVFVLAGITAWTFFNSAVQAASTSIVDQSTMSTRIYFPRMIFPLVAVGANLFGFVLSVAVLLLVAAIDGVALGARLLWLLPATALLVALTTSLALVLSGLHVYFRDVRYLVQAAFIAWLYLTPVIYSVEQAGQYGHLLPVNPATGVVLLFRAGVVGRDEYFLSSIGSSIAWTTALLVIGLLIHRRYDRVFADLL
ncbi:MAG: ABC transporter permease [Acidimicrobiales bacterium]